MAGSLGIGLGLGGSVGGGNNNSYTAVAGLLWELPSELVLNGDFDEIGPQLIQNPNFSLGLDLITNGDFSNGSTDWEEEGSSEITVGTYQGRENVARININDTSTGSRIRQPFTYVNGTTYKIVVNVYLESGSFRVDSSNSFVSTDFVQTTDTGSWQTLTAYFTAISSGSNYIWLRSSTEVSEFYVENISVQEVPYWTLGTGWSVEDGVAVASNSSANATQETFTIDAAKTYKIDFTISDYGGGTFFITFGGNDNSSNFTANGSYTVYITPTNRVNNIFYLRGSGFTGKIDNISVKEVVGWTLGTGWSVEDGKASNNGSSGSNNLTQPSILEVDESYEITITVSDYVSGNVEVSAGASPRGEVSANGTYTFYQQATPNNNFYIIANSFEGSIENVSVKEFALKPYPAGIVSDYNLAWDLDGLNYMPQASPSTDGNWEVVLGDELVQNGDFEDLGDNYIINPTCDTSIPFGTNGSGWKTIDASNDGTIEFFNGGIKLTRVGSTLKRLRATLSNGSQDVIPSTVKTYKIQYEVISATDDSSLAGMYFGGASIPQSSISTTVGVNTIYAESGGSNGIIQFQAYNDKEVVLDNISVQQVDPNDRWNAGNKWSISGGTANKATDATSNISQAIDGISGKLQKVVFTVSNYGGSGGVGASADGSNYTQNEGNGTFTEYITPNSNNLYIRASYSFVGSIDNVSVKEGGELIPKEI